MEILEICAVIISLCAFCFSVFMGLRGNKKTDEKEIVARVERETKWDVKLDEISRDIKEVKETLKHIQEDIKDHEGRLVKLEASYKAEHKRIDRIDEVIAMLQGVPQVEKEREER